LASGANKLFTPLQPTDNRLERLSIYTSQKIHLISIYNEIYEMDESFETVQYKWLNFQNNSCAGESMIDKIVEDQFGNIYLLTLNDGIRKIIHNNFPVKYYGTPKKEQNNIISLLPIKEENTILAGTFGNGLLVFDTLQRLKFHLKKLPNGETDISFSNIMKTGPHRYLLLQFHRNNAWIFNSLTLSIQSAPIQIAYKFGFYGKTVFNEKNIALVQYEDAFFRVFNGSAIKIQENILKVSFSFVGSTLYKNELLIGNNQFFEFYDTSNFTLRKKIPNKLNGGIRCITIDKLNNIYLGCDKGLVKMDSSGNTIWKLEKKDGLPDDCIYSIEQDENNDFWCSTNKGIFKITADKKIVVLRKEDGLQDNEFNTNVSYKTADGELYFGGVNGISAFHPDQINTDGENLQLLITDLKIDGETFFKDTAVWNLSSITLPYYQNNISINFTAFGAGNPDQYVYQYKMENVDASWTLDNLNGSARYTLQPGTYEFKMFASKSFDKNAKPLKVIKIRITAPFWKKIWFWVTAGLLLLGIIVFNINLYNKRKFAKKIIQLKEQQKIQEEKDRISKELHDNIGVQANAILHNATLLNDPQSNKDYLAGNLKETAKLMLVNLRETLWAMKSNDITAIDLWLRIINFMKQMGKNYTEIQFTIEGQAPEHKTIGSNKALHIVLVLQEAVNNAVKHAKARQIKMRSTINNKQWIIVLQDDGMGFILDLPTLKTDHYGISNMQQRAIDGKFELKFASTPGTGTQITVMQEL
jgi:signal transduction histidine kinase